jgi:hypothetical protein
LKQKIKFIKESKKKKRMRIIFEKIINLYYGSKDDIESKLKFDKRSKKLKTKSKLKYRRTHVLNSNTFYHYSFLDST